ncbi:CbrC family protein [Bacillus sp. BGMRC 2118]|nr:CbrC family protein [Bacillus sp. BGMRC 2118]
MKLPNYKYNPYPIKLGVIVEEETFCPVCEKKQEYVYQGPFYSEEEVEGICPWCIADGTAAKKYDGEFQDPASCDEVDDEKFVDELILRNPGYTGWQQEYWLSHCGDFCSIIGYVGWEEIKHLENELKEDINNICNEFQMSGQEFKDNLVNQGDFQGYLFQCNCCKKHRLHVDMS